jgi:hypothetical protein
MLKIGHPQKEKLQARNKKYKKESNNEGVETKTAYRRGRER